MQHLSPTIWYAFLGILMGCMAGTHAQGLSTTGAAADYPRRLQLGQQYMQLNPIKNAVANSVGGLEDSASLKQTFNAINYTLLERQGAELMAELFTAEEIKALNDFQSSPTGQRIMLKMPGYQKILGSKVSEEFRRAYELTLSPMGLLGGPRPATAATPTTPPRPVAPATPLGQGTPIGR
jgi:hypothetical protein